MQVTNDLMNRPLCKVDCASPWRLLHRRAWYAYQMRWMLRGAVLLLCSLSFQNALGQLRDQPAEVDPLERMAADLDREEVAVRAAALRDLTNRNEANTWPVLLRARLSRFPDVVAGVEGVVRRGSKEPAFQSFLQEQVHAPRGVISDLAMDVLQLYGKVASADSENYRNVVRQRLDLVRTCIEQFVKDFEDVRKRLAPAKGQPTSSPAASNGPKGLFREIEALRKGIAGSTPKEQVRAGIGASLLLERIGLLVPVITDLKRQSDGLKQESDLKNFVDRRLSDLLGLSGLITSAVEDKATLQIIGNITQWPSDLAQTVTVQIQRQFVEARSSLQKSYDYVKPLPSFKGAWADFRSNILSRLLQEIAIDTTFGRDSNPCPTRRTGSSGGHSLAHPATGRFGGTGGSCAGSD